MKDMPKLLQIVSNNTNACKIILNTAQTVANVEMMIARSPDGLQPLFQSDLDSMEKHWEA